MINQPIELGGKRGARIDVASRAQDAAGIELERKRNVLRADVIQAFYSSSTAQQRLLLSRQSIELAERGLIDVITAAFARSEEHTSELQSLMRISYAVFCLKKKKNQHQKQNQNTRAR